MALEQGFVAYVAGGIATACAGMTGGFALILPENFITAANPMSWTYSVVASQPFLTLDGQDALTKATFEIDCHGFAMANALTVADAIDSFLSGCAGTTLSDSAHTVVAGVFPEAMSVDGFNTDSRTFVRTIRFSVFFYQS